MTFGYAVKKDGSGWRAVGDAADCATDETFSETQPAIITPGPVPNGAAFISAAKAAMGGIVAANTLLRQYPAFIDAVNQQDWADVATLIQDAKTTGVLTATQYAAFQAAATANNIPITLP